MSWATLLAATVPSLLAYNQPPSATLLNQCVAVALWGGVVMALPPTRLPRSTLPLLGALAVVMAGAAASWAWGALPMSLALVALGLLASAALMVITGACAGGSPRSPAASVSASASVSVSVSVSASAFVPAFVPAFVSFALGLLAAGLLGTAVALVQVFMPGWADGTWIAPSGLAGRAVGNLRQPNHLCSLLLWATVAAVALHELGRLPRAALWAITALLVLAIELTASRTGAVGLGLLLLWALIDKRLSPSARWLLAATPLFYALAYAAMAWYGDWSQQTLGAGARLAAEGAAAAGADSPNSRLNIWRNALALIAAEPGAGVGFGEFNFAWSLSAFAHRPTAFFDHTHNLLLQLAVELGLPAATAVTGLLGLALWQALQRARQSAGARGMVARASLVLVLITLLHSLVEYPLWYAHFLLPTALAWGFVLGAPGVDTLAADSPSTSPPVTGARAWGMLAGLLMALGGAWAVVDYQREVVIYAPTDGSGSLAARIERGQRSWLFAHHADYAAATNEASPASTALGFARAPHSLLDTRLMVAWARHLAATGQVDRGRWLAQRLREFNNPEADDFFKPCQAGSDAEFQCQAPHRSHGWREFLAPAAGALPAPRRPQVQPPSARH